MNGSFLMESEKRPKLSQIYDALTSEDTTADWDSEILSRASSESIGLVRKMLTQYDYRELDGYFVSFDLER